jgi:hypothetical protein
MAFTWHGDKVAILSELDTVWSIVFQVPPFAPRGERMPVELQTPWEGTKLSVWRTFHPDGPDEEWATQGFLFERPSDGMGLLLRITEGSDAKRSIVSIWMPTDEMSGHQWESVFPLTADDFLGQLARLQSGKEDADLFPAEWLEKMKDDAQRKAHSEAGTR